MSNRAEKQPLQIGPMNDISGKSNNKMQKRPREIDILFQATNSDMSNRAEKPPLQIGPMNDTSGKSNNKTQKRLREIEMKQEKLQFGEFVWKIENFSEKIKQAKNDIETKFFSDAFFSHKNGYKMCLSVSPRGYGDKNSVYSGVCFHIMRGPLDDILQWPFKYDVTIALINRHTGLDHCSNTIKYNKNPNHENLQKPTVEINGGFGRYNFVKLDELLNNDDLYEKDQIFLKCTVRNH